MFLTQGRKATFYGVIVLLYGIDRKLSKSKNDCLNLFTIQKLANPKLDDEKTFKFELGSPVLRL